MLNTLGQYIKMPSTWKGIFALLAVAGVTLAPDQMELIVTIAVSGYGLYETFRKES